MRCIKACILDLHEYEKGINRPVPYLIFGSPNPNSPETKDLCAFLKLLKKSVIWTGGDQDQKVSIPTGRSPSLSVKPCSQVRPWLLQGRPAMSGLPEYRRASAGTSTRDLAIQVINFTQDPFLLFTGCLNTWLQWSGPCLAPAILMQGARWRSSVDQHPDRMHPHDERHERKVKEQATHYKSPHVQKLLQCSKATS